MSQHILKLLNLIVAKDQDEALEQVSSILESATRLSEDEVALASSSIRDIYLDLREHVQELQSVVAGSLANQEVANQMIHHQTSYQQHTSTSLGDQVELAAQSTQLSKDIFGFVDVIGKISDAARILTLNGQIESARLGSQGAAFSVISNQMRDLSLEVRRANEAIAELAGNLVKLMPTLDRNIHTLLENTNSYSTHQAQRISSFQSAAEHEREQLTNTLETRARRISQRAGTVVTHLQFQDRVAQNLDKASRKARDVGKLFSCVLSLLAQHPELETLSENDMHAILQEAKRNAGIAHDPETSAIRCEEIPDDGVLMF